jgi:hypothetical protein
LRVAVEICDPQKVPYKTGVVLATAF